MLKAKFKGHLAKFAGYFQPFDWHHTACSVPGIAACLLWGLVTHDTVTAAMAAGSAFSVGFRPQTRAPDALDAGGRAADDGGGPAGFADRRPFRRVPGRFPPPPRPAAPAWP
ncbi:MAG: hypothetical protein WDN06_11365 [Asticcacaulis sp.]